MINRFLLAVTARGPHCEAEKVVANATGENCRASPPDDDTSTAEVGVGLRQSFRRLGAGHRVLMAFAAYDAGQEARHAAKLRQLTVARLCAALGRSQRRARRLQQGVGPLYCCVRHPA